MVGFQYDAASDPYTYVWKTSRDWAGTCRRLTLTLDDGSAHSAIFQFRKRRVRPAAQDARVGLAGACLVAAGCPTGQDRVVTPSAANDGTDRAERVPVRARGGTLHVTIRWPGDGEVTLALMTPDGRRVTHIRWA